MINLRSQRLPLLIILTISFLSTVGMGLVFPVLPFVVGSHVTDPGATAFWVGILEAVYAACAFVAAPFLGALSDRIGRRPVLVVSLIGSAVGWALFGLGGALWILLLARVIDGLTAGDMSVAFAYLADITDPGDRARRFGLAGAVGGVGFLVGPAIGGLLASVSLTAPLFAAAAVTMLTAILAAIALPESLRAERRSTRLSLADVDPFRALRDAVTRPELGSLIVVFALAAVPLAVIASNVPVLAMDVLSWNTTQVGLLMSGVGIVDIVVQGGLLALLLRTMGERGVVIGGLLGQAVGCGLIVVMAAFVPSSSLLVVGTLSFAMAQGATGAVLQGLLSQAVGDEEQGWLAGSMSAIGSAVQMVGPLLAGLLYLRVAPFAPYLLAAGVLLAATILVRGRAFSASVARRLDGVVADDSVVAAAA
jgi:DHA1 family tetracycline resistance protein-like MFS transporter